MESSSDELPEIEGTSTLWKGDEQSQSEFQPVGSEETKSEGENETTMTDNVKPLVLSEELSRVLCLSEGSSTKVTQNEGAENLLETRSIQSYESENASATLVPTESHASLLSEELKNVLSFNEERSKNVNLVAGEPENDFENVEGEKTIDDNAKTLKRPIRTATRRLRSHNRSRRYQHERSTLSYSDEADVHEVHSSITRFGSISDLQHDVSVLHIKRKRSHSADSSDFPASFSDSSPQATDPSTDEELPTCATCGKCFRKKYSLVKHVFTHVPDESRKTEETTASCTSKTEQRPLLTATRRLSGQNQSRRDQHAITEASCSQETDVYDVHCSIVRFAAVSGLQQEMSELHVNRKRTHSPDSSDIAQSLSDSSPQATDPSTDDELPSCSTCGKCFRKKYDLIKHVFKHIPDVCEPNYLCKECGKVNSSVNELRKHRRGHLI